MICDRMNGDTAIWYGVLLVEDRKIEVRRFTCWCTYKEVGDLTDVVWTTRLFEAETYSKAYRKAHGMIYERYIR